MKNKKGYRFTAAVCSAVLLFTQAAVTASATKDSAGIVLSVSGFEVYSEDGQMFENPYVYDLYKLYGDSYLDYYKDENDPFSVVNGYNKYKISLYSEHGLDWMDFYDESEDAMDDPDAIVFSTPYLQDLYSIYGSEWRDHYDMKQDAFSGQWTDNEYAQFLYKEYGLDWYDHYKLSEDPFGGAYTLNDYVLDLFYCYGLYWKVYYDPRKDPDSPRYDPYGYDWNDPSYYDSYGDRYPLYCNEGYFNEDGSYDRDDPYMILQKLYDDGGLTPEEAYEIYTIHSADIYNPFMDRNNPAYYKAGPDITWEVTNHTLKMTGSGKMYSAKGDDIMLNWKRFANVVEEIRFDDRITEIGDRAFSDFNRLLTVTLPAKLKRVGEEAFDSCDPLEKVVFSDGIESIGKNAFSYCSIRECSFPDSLKVLEENALSNNYNLLSVTLPDGIESIGSHCFACCQQLEQINIPDTVQYIGNEIFYQDYKWYAQQKDKFIIIGDGYLYGYQGDEPVIIVPEGVKHMNADSLARLQLARDYDDVVYAAYSIPNSDVKQIILPKSLQDMREFTLSGMRSLKEVDFLGNQIKSIEAYMFQNDIALQTVDWPDSIEFIGERAFDQCSSLELLEIPKNVKKIGTNAFNDTPFLKTFPEYMILGDGILYKYNGFDKCLDIPDGVKRISSYALSAREFISITMPESLRIIESNAIQSYDLVEINLNDGLETLETEAISSGKYLTSLYVPETLADYTEESLGNNKLTTVVGHGPNAKQFSKVFGLTYTEKEPEYEKKGKDMTLDPEKDCWSFGNFSDVFGGIYYFTDRDKHVLSSLPGRDSLLNKESWTGACFGMTASIILLKAGVYKPGQLKEGAKTVHELEPDEKVQSFINYYHNVQYLTSFTMSGQVDSASMRMYKIINTAKHVKDGELPFMISFQTSDFGHAVIGYGQEDGNWSFNNNDYDGRILVWDPNYPNTFHETSCIYYNSHSFNYCIPHYNLYYKFNDISSGSGYILYMCNDLERLDPNPYEFEVSASSEITGDINRDTIVDVSDAVILARYIAEDSTLRIPTASVNKTDVNADGKVDPSDVVTILRIIAKLEAA